MESKKQYTAYLSAEFSFTNFTRALEFVNQIGALAEELGHHPDISFGWGYVKVQSTTHDAGNSITTKDTDLMDKITNLYQHVNIK